MSLDALTAPQPQAAHAYWLKKCRDRAMPAPNDVNPADIPRLLPYITLIEILYEEPIDYLYRIEGEAVRMAFGVKRMGKRLSEMREHMGAAYPGLLARLDAVRTSGEPLAHSSMLTMLSRRLFALEAVLLPLSHDGGKVERILACTGFIAQPLDEIADISSYPSGTSPSREGACPPVRKAV